MREIMLVDDLSPLSGMGIVVHGTNPAFYSMSHAGIKALVGNNIRLAIADGKSYDALVADVSVAESASGIIALSILVAENVEVVRGSMVYGID